MSVKLLIALAVALAAASPTQVAGVWEKEDTTSRLDGRREVMQAMWSTNEIARPYGGSTRATIMIRCANDKIVTFLAIPGVMLRSDPVLVEWRVGEGDLMREQWPALSRAQGAVYRENHNRLLDAIAGGGELLARIGGAYEVEFDLADGAAAVASVREACP